MATGTDRPGAIEFGRFRIDRQRREFLEEGRRIDLGDRAFDTLLALLDGGGAVLSKDELLRRIWPDRVVEENNLEIQISALRKALGADRQLIRTVHGRGYQFTGTIHEPGASPRLAVSTNLPVEVSELIGRETAVQSVLDLAVAQRLVTLTGSGGVGKTRLGLEVARRLLGRFAHGVWLAELAPLTDGDLVAVTVGAALGLPLGSATVTAERVATAVADRRLLLVLDNCEHVIDAAARMAAALLSTGPRTVVLATSREPLAIAGEHIYRVPSLEVPAEDNLDADDMLRHGAVRLFSMRAAAVEAPSVSDRRHAATVAAICRRLDGIPLAIELAAARVAALGVEGISERLDDRFRLLTTGRRTALARHQTLRATLDWSYELLSEPERIVLRRLGVFAGSFSVEAACAIVASPELPAAAAADGVASLVSRSLIVAQVAGGSARHRLLETTRAYAREHLEQAGELQIALARHASYFRDTMETAEADWPSRPTAEWLATYAHTLDDVRAALDWAFAPGGDTAIGTALTIAAVPLWLELSLLNESFERVQRACETGAPVEGRLAMKLHAALAMSTLHVRGPRPEIDTLWTTLLDMAEGLDDDEYRLRAIWGQYACRNQTGSGRMGLALAQRFADIAARRPNVDDQAIADRLIGASLHYIGDQESARRHIERMLERQPRPVTYRSQTMRFLFDQRVLALNTLTHVVWLQGAPGRAAELARQAVAEGEATGHHHSLCFALAEAASAIALYTGDLVALDGSVTRLLDVTSRHGSVAWHAVGRCLQGVLLVKRGDADAYRRLVQPAFQQLGEGRYFFHYTGFLAALADGLGAAGRMTDAPDVIAEAFARCEVTEEEWSLPELLRVRGELLAREDAGKKAQAQFEEALERARSRGMLAWELRAAASLARLWQRESRTRARRLLAPVLRRFTDGFETADLVSARALLKTLG